MNKKAALLLLVVLATVCAATILWSNADAHASLCKPLGDPIDNPVPLYYASTASTWPLVDLIRSYTIKI